VHVVEVVLPPPASNGSNGTAETSGDLTLAAAEYHHIHIVLDRFRGNKRRTARALGVSRSTLDRKLREHQSPHAE